MKFRPLHDRVVVKRIDAEEKTAGGIIIPDSAKEKPSQGEITAVIRVKKGHEDTMRRALLEVAENVRINEPNTIGFFVSQEEENPSVFTTYERFRDEAAMDAHNNSTVVARFFGIAKPILDGDVILVTCSEISAKA